MVVSDISLILSSNGAAVYIRSAAELLPERPRPPHPDRYVGQYRQERATTTNRDAQSTVDGNARI
jgi:hypothetical protein